MMPNVVAPRRSMLQATTLQRSLCADFVPSCSLTRMKVGINAALNDPLMTLIAKEGTIKAMRKASISSPVPKDAATTSSFPVATTFVTKVNKAMMRVALKILRFVETLDQSVHFFMISCIHAFLA